MPKEQKMVDRQLRSSKMSTELNGSQSTQKRFKAEHLIHAEFWKARLEYAKLIESTKLTHWTEFIENASNISIWSIHNYMTRNPTDGGRTKVPTLYKTDPSG